MITKHTRNLTRFESRDKAGSMRAAAALTYVLTVLAVICTAVEAPQAPSESGAGSISASLVEQAEAKDTLQLVNPANITAVKAVGRKITPAGMETTVTKGLVKDNQLMVNGLDPSADIRYDLRIELKDGGVIQGWNAKVPESDYVKQWPLEDKAKKTIFKQMTGEDFAAFYDEIQVLDVQGNAQHAAVLVERIRRRPFVGGNYKEGEWVWRVGRFQWESPKEGQWVPWQEMPFYALVRQRLYEKDYKQKSVVYARHLGGIQFSDEKTKVELGEVVIPEPGNDVYAVEPNGKKIPTQRLK